MSKKIKLLLPKAARPLFDKNRDYKKYLVMRGGRGSAKSTTAAIYVILKMLESTLFVVCAREVQHTISDSVHRLICKVIEDLELSAHFKINKTSIVCESTGSEAVFKGLYRDPSAIKSLDNCGLLWIEEATAISVDSWRTVTPTIRKMGASVLLTYNPEFRDDAVDHYLSKEYAKKNALIMEMNWRDNPFWNEALEIERQICLNDNPYEYDHIYEGGYLEDMHNPLALFTKDVIENNRKNDYNIENFKKVVIGVDPAGSCKNGSDETGIIVAAATRDKHAYVLDDQSGKYTPSQWAAKIIQLYDQYKADRVVIETNFGGDMVKATIESEAGLQNRHDINIKKVVSSRGKALRAEPVSALYKQNRVHHVKQFSFLEKQMVIFNKNNENKKSPDRLDALVFALTDLAVFKTRDLTVRSCY